MSGKKLRFGIMCQGTTFASWEGECIRSLIRSGIAEPSLIIVDAEPGGASDFIRELKEINRLLYRVYTKLWNHRRTAAYRPVDLAADLRDVPSIRCRAPRKGRYSRYFLPAEVAEIRDHDLDFILRFGFNIIRGEVLDAARYGVWSYHHDDECLYRGGPSGYWEIVNGDPTTGAILQRLTDRLDGGIVLHKGYFKTRRRFTKNRDSVAFGCADWCVRVCKEIQLGDVAKFSAPPSRTDAPIFLVPTNLQFLGFIARQFMRFATAIFKWTFYLEIWNVGLVHTPLRDAIAGETVKSPQWFPLTSRYGFVADPFALPGENGLHILLEEYSYFTAKGRISAVTIGPTGHREWHPSVIDGPAHLAYPYLFESDGNVYCMPSGPERNDVVLYRAVTFPSVWEPVGQLLDDFAAVDATVFQYQARWWLFCTDDRNRPNENLYVWYAESLQGPWTPHPLNPVKTDVRSSRPGGRPFEVDGVLYRPAQDCSRTYGGATSINRVVRLDPTGFEEELVRLVRNDEKGPFPLGLHTVCEAGGTTVIDGKTWLFSLFATPLKIRRNWLERKRIELSAKSRASAAPGADQAMR